MRVRDRSGGLRRLQPTGAPAPPPARQSALGPAAAGLPRAGGAGAGGAGGQLARQPGGDHLCRVLPGVGGGGGGGPAARSHPADADAAAPRPLAAAAAPPWGGAGVPAAAPGAAGAPDCPHTTAGSGAAQRLQRSAAARSRTAPAGGPPRPASPGRQGPAGDEHRHGLAPPGRHRGAAAAAHAAAAAGALGT